MEPAGEPLVCRFDLDDRYVAVPDGEGARLKITSTITYTRWWGKLTRRLMLPGWRDQLSETFSDAIDVFEDERGRA